MCAPRARVTQKGVVTAGEALGAGDHLTVVDRSHSVGRFLSQEENASARQPNGPLVQARPSTITQLSTLKSNALRRYKCTYAKRRGAMYSARSSL
jgi:hypothetical protein